MGDFNTDLFKRQSPRSLKLLHIIESVNLQVLPLQATHHNNNGDNTWLDIILTSTPSLVSSHGQYPAPVFSHHDLIFLSYILKPPKPQPKVLHRRCFSKLNIEKLREEATMIDWEPMIAANTIDAKVHCFNDFVLKLYDAHAPVRKCKIKRPPAPWITDNIRVAMKRRDRAYQNYRRERSDVNLAFFKTARNRCNQLVRNAKRRYILSNISFSSQADVWKFLGTLGIGKIRHVELPGTIHLDDINRHFATSAVLDDHTKFQTINHIASLPKLVSEPFFFTPIASEEVRKIILSIKSNAVGHDNISRRMIVMILDQVLSAVVHLINFSLSAGQFPSQWRKAYVRPLPKVSSPILPNHYRPISILPFMSKVVESCVQKQLSEYVQDKNLLDPLQSGFRPGHSTITALLKVTGDVRAGVEDAKVTILVLVDFSNAFNSVSHEILLSILSRLNISSDALGWFSTYLQGRQQSVRINETSSNWCSLDSGVPQGGILSPLLFSLFINLLTLELQCAYHLYADDLQLYTQTRIDSMDEAIAKTNRDLKAIEVWCERFGLSVNPTKSQAIIVGSPYMVNRIDLSSLPPILFKGSTITVSGSVKNLGLHIDAKLEWRSQIVNVSQKVTGTLRSLYRLRKFLPIRTKAMLVQALIFPTIDYGDVCYLDLNADLLNKLDRLLNNCIRFVFNLRKYDHITSYRSDLNWLPIRQRRNWRALTMLFSILHYSNTPSYLTSLFEYLCSNHTRHLRSTNNHLLLCPSHRSSLVHSSFHVQAVLLWNALPLEIRMSTNRNAFKKKVRQLFSDSLAESSPP